MTPGVLTASEMSALRVYGKRGMWKVALRTGELECCSEAAALHGPAFDGGPRPAVQFLAALQPEDRTAVLSALVEATTTGFASFEYDWVVDGASRRVRALVRACREQDDSLRFTGLVEDVTDRFSLEQTLRRKREEADAASHAKSRFLATMSHEIRTPMNAVLGMTRLVLDSSLTEEQREYLQAVETSGEALLALINDILDLSKIEAGKLDLDSGVLRPAEILCGIATTLSVRAHEKGVEVITDIDASVAIELEGDARRFGQIVTNLLGNAIKFTYAGEIFLRARHADGVLTVRFEDSGIGIAETELATIFHPFVQVNPETTREFGGTGLGLAIARELVALMDGSMTVESIVGRGSQFEVRIPVPGARSLAPGRREAASAVRRRVATLTRTTTLGEVVARQLGQLGCDVHSVTDAAELFRTATASPAGNHPLDLVIEQDLLGAISGIELARSMRRLPGVGAIVLLTRLSARFSERELDDAGVTTVLRKPARPEAILEALEARSPRSSHAPRVEVVALPVPPLPRPAPVAAAPSAANARRVLVVEDEKLNARLLCALLDRLSFTPVHARNGAEALEMATSQTFVLILMDLQMPVLDGIEATAGIRRHESNMGGRTPIVALTANAMSGDRERCLAAGMDDYLSKPIALPDLVAVLERYATPAPIAETG